jgi:hypothetical protein
MVAAHAVDRYGDVHCPLPAAFKSRASGRSGLRLIVG